jgi:hypothetical protein
MPELPKSEHGPSEQESSNKRHDEKKIELTGVTKVTKDPKGRGAKTLYDLESSMIVNQLTAKSRGVEISLASETTTASKQASQTLKLSDYERWNNLCAAMAEDVVLDELPPSKSVDIDRIKGEIFDLMASQRGKR